MQPVTWGETKLCIYVSPGRLNLLAHVSDEAVSPQPEAIEE